MEDKDSDFDFLDNYFHNFNLLFYAIVCGSLVFFVVVFLKVKGGTGFKPSFQPQDPYWYYLIAVICLLLIFPAYILYSKEIKKIPDNVSLQEKLDRLKSTSLIKYAIIEIGNMIALAMLFFTEEQLFLVLYAIMLTIFAINRPTPYRVVKDLQLSGEEQKKVRSYRSRA